MPRWLALLGLWLGASFAWTLLDPQGGMDAALVRGLLVTLLLGVAWAFWVRPPARAAHEPEAVPETASSPGFEALVADAMLPDQGGVARFAFPDIARRWRRLLLRRAAWGVALAAGLVAVSGAVNPRLNVLAAVWAALAAATGIGHYRRLRRLDRTFEISAFNLTEIRADGGRRVIPWNQPLVLRNRAWLRRVDVGPPGLRERISLEWELADLDRAVQLIVEYGGFQPAEPAPEGGSHEEA